MPKIAFSRLEVKIGKQKKNFTIIANLRYPAKNQFLCWLVDIPIDTKRLKD